jgi:hypothetical protein
VIRCSDCDTRLVASEEDAIEGRQAVTRDPYRMLAALSDERAARVARSPWPPGAFWPASSFVQGLLLSLAGLLFAVLVYSATANARALYLVVLGPMLHGLLSAGKGGPATAARKR